MKAIFQKYVGQQIGINCKGIGQFHAATLTHVGDDYFSIQIPKSSLTIHYPYRQVLFASESADGHDTAGLFGGSGGLFSGPKVPFLVQVYVLKTGGVGVGVGFAT